MSIADVKLVYVLSCLALGLIILSPTIMAVFPPNSGEPFSELYMLGPNRRAQDYPFNVRANEVYSVYLGVGNHMGSPSYYVLYVKFRDPTEPLPNATTGVPSPLAPLYEYRVFVADNSSKELPLTFYFPTISIGNDRSVVGGLVVNGVPITVNKAVSWNAEKGGYYFQLFVELWIYDSLSDGFSYHNRFVSRWLNMTNS